MDDLSNAILIDAYISSMPSFQSNVPSLTLILENMINLVEQPGMATTNALSETTTSVANFVDKRMKSSKITEMSNGKTHLMLDTDKHYLAVNGYGTIYETLTEEHLTHNCLVIDDNTV